MGNPFDWQDEHGLAALGAGLKGFAQGWQDAEDRKMKRMEMDSKLEAQRNERIRQAELDQMTAREKGYEKSANGEYVEAPMTARQQAARRLEEFKAGARATGQDEEGNATGYEYNPDYLRIQEQKANADPLGLKGAQLQNALLESTKKRQDIAQAAEEARRKTLSPLQGYQKSPTYVASPVEEQHLRNAQASVAKFNQLMSGLKAKVQAADQTELANPYSNTAKAIKNDLRDLQLTYKNDDFAKLGVLTGPDLRLLEEIIENPGSVSNLVSGKEGVLNRYDQATERVNSGFANKVSSLGLQKSAEAPRGRLAGGKLATGVLDTSAKPAPKGGPKVGAVEGGYRFKGGDPSDQKNWEKVN